MVNFVWSAGNAIHINVPLNFQMAVGQNKMRRHLPNARAFFGLTSAQHCIIIYVAIKQNKSELANINLKIYLCFLLFLQSLKMLFLEKTIAQSPRGFHQIKA